MAIGLQNHKPLGTSFITIQRWSKLYLPQYYGNRSVVELTSVWTRNFIKLWSAYILCRRAHLTRIRMENSTSSPEVPFTSIHNVLTELKYFKTSLGIIKITLQLNLIHCTAQSFSLPCPALPFWMFNTSNGTFNKM